MNKEGRRATDRARHWLSHPGTSPRGWECYDSDFKAVPGLKLLSLEPHSTPA